MAYDESKPKPDAKIGLPAPTPGSNKIAPVDGKPDDKGTKPKKKSKAEKSKEELREQAILERMRKRFERCISAEAENRKAMVEDAKFLAGEQWNPSDVAERANTQRPCLTINKLPTFVHQVTNQVREERPAINVNPVGDRADKDAAKVYRGLIRHIERMSAAEIAYDTAYARTVELGLGYWRLLTEYESPKTFQQCIRIVRVRNIFTVYLDPDHLEPDGADARFGFITEMVPREEFNENWPNADPVAFDLRGQGESYKDWSTKDQVRIAEYFEIENETRTLVLLSNGTEVWEDEIAPELKAMIDSDKIEIRRRRESQCPKVCWYKATIKELLSEKDWLGSSIPIIKVTGDEFDVEGKVKYAGIVRFAKDPQRMLNYWACLALNTPLPTPSGWTTMGAVKAGDVLFDENGKPTNVLGTSPVYINRDCFEIAFDDGSKIVADSSHLWQVEERGVRRSQNTDWSTRVVQTTDLVPGKHYIYATKPLEVEDSDLPIHPYFLGLWLGDGSSAEPRLCAGDQDIEEIREHLSAFGMRCGPIGRYPGKVGTFQVYGQRHEFTKLGLLGNKHIPAAYLRASRQQREWLLQGLMDTDGWVSKGTRQCGFTNTNEAIVDGISELLRSLGIKAVALKRAGRLRKFPQGRMCETQDSWQFAFSCGADDRVFRLRRKLSAQTSGGPTQARRTKRFSIRSVTPIASVPVKCVKVDSPSHLFLAGQSMVPTHNTKETEAIALAPNAPWVMEEGQIEGHEKQWENANRRPIPVLTYKATSVNGTLAPPPQRQSFAGIPEGIVNAKQGAAQDMMATTGVRFDATVQDHLYDESGRALREHRRTGDIGTFHLVDNLARALKRTGEMIIEIIPKVYDTKRTLTILRDDDTEESIVVDPAAGKPLSETKDPQTQKIMKVFNPTVGKYGVTVTIGPSYATKRVEAAESMMDFVRALPQTGEMLADLVAKNQDWPGAEEMATRLAKAIAMKFPGVMSPDMKGVSPQVQAVLTQLQTQLQQLTQERQQMIKMLSDQGAERALEKEKIDKDFEAKLLKITADLEAKTAATQQAGVDTMLTHIAAIAKNMETLMSKNDAPQSAG